MQLSAFYHMTTNVQYPPDMHVGPRHVLQRRHYDANRYARHLSQAELDRRIRDIVLNLLRVTPDGKIGCAPSIDNEYAAWVEKFTHALEEMQLRNGPYPGGFTPNIFHSEPFPNFACDLSEKAAKRMSALGLKDGNVLIKYGKRSRMEPLFSSGALRIQPASFFSDPITTVRSATTN